MAGPSAAQAHPFESGLGRGPANHVPLTPVSFLARAAAALGDKVAVIDGARSLTYAALHARCRRLASALARRGIGRLDTVAILAGNTPEMIEAHFAVPMRGAVLNPLNIRLDPATLAFSLDHGEAKVLIVDADHAALAGEALARLGRGLLVAVAGADAGALARSLPHAVPYEDLLAEGDPDHAPAGPEDEWQSLCLLYTSGTTGDPKGAVYSHRGAYLQALGNALAFGLSQTASISGRCRCSTATAGPTLGRWWRRAARRSACARSSRRRSSG